MSRFVAINLPGLALLGAAWDGGWLRTVWQSDPTYLTVVIAAVFAAGLAMAGRAAVGRGESDKIRWIAVWLVRLGLIGTVAGFLIALSGLDPERASDVTAMAAMVATMIEGIYVALYTTLVGSVCGLWLEVNHRLMPWLQT